MKLISLNAWGCRIEEPIYEFVRECSDSIDIFCFQEILKCGEGKTTRDEIKNCYERIDNILTDHIGYFSEYGEGGYYSERVSNLDFSYGIACFVNKDLNSSLIEGIKLYDPQKKWSDYSGRFAAGAAQAIEVTGYSIVNVHGLWQGGIKEDTEAKIEQSRIIIDLANKTAGGKIVCGDFNLLPDTKSIQLLRDKYKDLISDYGIDNTRSSLYNKELRYSDYAFADNNISINSFSVPNLEISDHLPLILEFDK